MSTSFTPELPDLASLANLANDFFRALPTASFAGVSSLVPAGIPLSVPSLTPSPTAAAALAPAHLSSPSLSIPDPAGSRPSPAIASTPDSTSEDWVTAQAFGLPGADTIRALLTDSVRPPSALGSAQTPAAVPPLNPFAPPVHPGQTQPGLTPGLPSPGYYFLGERPYHLEKSPAIPAQVHEHKGFDVHAVRRDFPILSERVNGKPLVWFDNAATTQKPKAVIDRLAYFYQHENSNIHRAAHELAARSTDAYEGARSKVARFLNAGSAEEIVFVRGATEAINLVASTFGRQHIGKDDEIVLSLLEHHANIVPWQLLAESVGAKIRVIPVDSHGQLRLDEYAKLLNDRTKLVSVTQVSNALGTVTPVADIVAMAHKVGARVLIDGAQAVSHMKVDVRELDADFYVFSGHKIFAPTGIGVVYGKKDLLDSLPPYQGGGNMIADVTFERTVYQKAPARFEAGTGNIADAVGLGAALDYLERLGMDAINRYEHDLLIYGTHGLKSVPGLKLIGTAPDKASVMSFVLAGFKTEEVGKALNEEGIAVRSGHHCAQPILRHFGLEASVRPSLAFYNTCEEVDHLVATLKRLVNRSRTTV